MFVQATAAAARALGSLVPVVWSHGFEHLEPLQVRPVPQSFPHEPQFCSSVVMSVQTPLQATWVPVHWRMHALPEQILPPPHCESLQHSKHAVWLQQFGELPLQPWLEHEVPLLLQLSTVQPFPSLQSESVQHTLHADPQSLGVAGAQLQLPVLHAAPGLQGSPQPPQLFESVPVFVSQPGLPLQSAKPASQEIWLAEQC